MIYKWYIEIWVEQEKRWSGIASSISEGLAEEIVEGFKRRDLERDGKEEHYQIVPPPIDYGR